MPTGEAFSERQHEEIVRAIRQARQESGLPVSVYVGELTGEPRAAAARLHGALGADMDRAVLVAVDPTARSLEIVTGRESARHLDERACALASMSMTSAFQGGDLAGGIVTGVRMLAEQARAPRTLHSDQPDTPPPAQSRRPG